MSPAYLQFGVSDGQDGRHYIMCLALQAGNLTALAGTLGRRTNALNFQEMQGVL